MSDFVKRKQNEYKEKIQNYGVNQESFSSTMTSKLPYLAENTSQACLNTLCIHMQSVGMLKKNDIDFIKAEPTPYTRNHKFYNEIITKPFQDVLPLLLAALEDNASSHLAEKILVPLKQLKERSAPDDGYMEQ